MVSEFICTYVLQIVCGNLILLWKPSTRSLWVGYNLEGQSIAPWMCLFMHNSIRTFTTSIYQLSSGKGCLEFYMHSVGFYKWSVRNIRSNGCLVVYDWEMPSPHFEIAFEYLRIGNYGISGRCGIPLRFTLEAQYGVERYTQQLKDILVWQYPLLQTSQSCHRKKYRFVSWRGIMCMPFAI